LEVARNLKQRGDREKDVADFQKLSAAKLTPD
jgi:hypothetical protein